MKDLTTHPALQPFPRCPALDGYHCVTNSLAKIFHHHHHPLSEDMLLGLGAGMGFIYWQMKMGPSTSVFIGGRGNAKDFYADLGRRTGVEIREVRTASAKKAEASLLLALASKSPVMLGGDMGRLPWFDLPPGYHFGGHAFVVCGFDGDKTFLASDIQLKMTGLKTGLYAPISLDQLREARSSPFKPFPPKNLQLEFDFRAFRPPGPEEIASAIQQSVDAHLNPPIKNFGVSGMRHTARELLRWPELFPDQELRMNLFNLYIFIEVGGTGGGCFRYMYSRFLTEAAKITSNPALLEAAQKFDRCGRQFTAIASLFQDTRKVKNLAKRIQTASDQFRDLADREEEAHQFLSRSI
jgi:hypothetical protein